MTRLGMLLSVTGLLAAVAAGAAGADAHTQARLVLAAEVVKPGSSVLAGVHLKMDEGWHTYWLNSGDSGMATTIEWTLPAGVTAGEIQWPVAEKLVEEGLATYVYHHEVMLLVPLTIGKDVPAGDLPLKAKVAWLECEKMCLPGEQQVSAVLKVGAETKLSADAEVIQKWQGKLPKAPGTIRAEANWEKPVTGNERRLIIEWTATDPAQPDFLPYPGKGYEVQGATEVISTDQGKIRLRKTVKKLEGDWPTQIAGVVVSGKETDRAGCEVKLEMGGSAPAGAWSGTRNSTPGGRNDTPAPGLVRPLWEILLYAFLGGLILNIMPCVLPVIALKILGFVGQAKDSPARVRKLGLVYGAGVLTSFLVFAVVVIALQSAGKQVGWGMQFANPYFLLFLTVLVTLVALNLFGLFEITLSGRLMGAAGDLSSGHGASGAFFNGVLATILATPCTAPFLAPAIGFAFVALKAWTILLVFSVVAVGLAFPYVVLSWRPGWLKYLPKPGAWMERFKVAMGFPMLGTGVWLFSLLLIHYGERTWWVALFLVVVGLAAWIFGEFIQRGSRRKGLAWIMILLVLGAGYAFALESQLKWRQPLSAAETTTRSAETPKDGIRWEPWSTAAVEKARSEGRPVFVDFTADWCLTCQANKKVAIEIPSVIEKLKQINAVALLGDYTRQPPEMTKELYRFQRAGVPLVLVYPADAARAPIVLPEALTPGIVLDALEKAMAK